MNSTTYQSIFGHPKVRKTWKHTLSAEKNAARIQQMRFCKEIRKLLGEGYEVEFHFNPGGPAVWGETFVHIFKNPPQSIGDTCAACGEGNEWCECGGPVKVPIVEACLSHNFSYMRQWNGQHSGRNHQVSYIRPLDPTAFAMAVRKLERRPFIRF